MFEAILTLCLMAAEPVCRDRLLPGFAAASEAGCRAALADDPPDLSGRAEALDVSGPDCRAAGEALEVAEVAPGVFAHLGQVAEPDAANRGDVSNLGVN